MHRLKALGLVGEPVAVAFVTSVSVAAAVVAMAAFVHARATAEREAAWLRQRLAEKRALVRSLQSDLAVVAHATERVSQMASMARGQNVEVRRLAQVEEPRQPNYTPARLAALDDAVLDRSDDAARALAQLAFLEEQFAATTDSLVLMTALARPSRDRHDEPNRSEAPRVRPAVLVTSTTPAGWPVRGQISSGFGWRDDPYGGGPQRHTGLDISADYGAPIAASASGVVVFAGRDSGGYGKAIVIDHGQNVKTLYGHLSGIYVHQGQRVERGMAIGAVGNSGRSTGVHLHYEVRVGNVPVDPMRYVQGGVQRMASSR